MIRDLASIKVSKDNPPSHFVALHGPRTRVTVRITVQFTRFVKRKMVSIALTEGGEMFFEL